MFGAETFFSCVEHRTCSGWHTGDVLRGTHEMSCVEHRRCPAWNTRNVLLGTQDMSCLQHRKSRNSLCYAHTAGLPWTCGLKSVSVYFSSDGVTQQIHNMIAGVLVERTYFYRKNNEKKLPNLSKNLRKLSSGPSLRLLLEPLWSLLGSILDTCSQKTGF